MPGVPAVPASLPTNPLPISGSSRQMASQADVWQAYPQQDRLRLQNWGPCDILLAHFDVPKPLISGLSSWEFSA